MRRTLAGIYDPRQRGSAEAIRSLVAEGMRDEGSFKVWSEGPLAVAYTAADGATPGESGPVRCLLDGQVYNAKLLAQAVGIPASDPPDQILAGAYRRLGPGLFERLRGDFVLILWNRESRAGLIARDQLGGRPLCFHSVGTTLRFASEVRNLLSMLPSRPGPDDASVVQWLASSSMPSAGTLYQGVRRLPAGHYIRLGDQAQAETLPYWGPRRGPRLQGSRTELVDALRETLKQAVERRLPSGEGAAIKLSGGLDSSAVAAMAAGASEHGGSALPAYSATFPNHPAVDESDLIERVTRELGLPWIQIRVHDGSVLAGALEYIHAWQTPPVSPNGFFWGPLLTRAAQDGVGVMLDGEGGDEIFGLSEYLIADRVRRGRLLAAARLARRVPGYPGAERPPWPAALGLVREYGPRGAVPHAAHRALRSARDPARYAPEWFTDDSARLLFHGYDPWTWKRARGPRWQASLIGAVITNPPASMVQDHVRRRSALAGLEARHPLVDVDLLDLILRIPPELAFDARHSRPLLREALAGLIPDEVRLRHAKSNFDAVFHERMAGGDLAPMRELVCAPEAEIGAYVKREIVREFLGHPPLEHPGALGQWALEAWRLVTAECWLRTQADRSFATDLLATGRLAEPRYELVRAGAPA